MICVVCQHPDRATERGQVCEPCRLPLPGLLDDIARRYGELTAEPPAAAGGAGPKVSGSRVPPVPVDVDALDLTLPARLEAVHDDHGDQIGWLPAASRLDTWVRDWRERRWRRYRENLPVPTVAVLCAWLRDRLDWACDEHPAVDEFVAEMRALRRDLRTALRDWPAQPQRLWTPCKCDALGLARHPGDDYPVRCVVCDRAMTEDEYASWTKLVAAYESEGAAA